MKQFPASVSGAPFLALLAATAIGCADRSGLDKVPISGEVTLDGQPIPNGEILFYPAEGTKGSVSGGAIKDGKYVADGRGGVPLGKHHVEIRAYRASTKVLKGEVALEGGPAEQYLPKKYNVESELQADVDDSTTEINFQLQSK